MDVEGFSQTPFLLYLGPFCLPSFLVCGLGVECSFLLVLQLERIVLNSQCFGEMGVALGAVLSHIRISFFSWLPNLKKYSSIITVSLSSPVAADEWLDLKNWPFHQMWEVSVTLFYSIFTQTLAVKARVGYIFYFISFLITLYIQYYLKNNINDKQNRNRLTDTENRLMAARGQECWGWGENGEGIEK